MEHVSKYQSTYRLGIADVGKVASDLQLVHNLRTSTGITLDSERQDTAKMVFAELLRRYRMIGMIGQTGIVDPAIISAIDIRTHETCA
jgi:hypothetical protein